jgi:hypothetical protein
MSMADTVNPTIGAGGVCVCRDIVRNCRMSADPRGG